MAMASSRHGLPLVLSALLLAVAVLTLSVRADVKRYQFDVSTHIYTYKLLTIAIALVIRGFVVVVVDIYNLPL